MALEEADRILLRTLWELGFAAHEEEAVGSLADLTPEQVFAAVSLCVRHVRPKLADSVAARMPASLSARLAMCAAMADCCRELGFRGDIGYQTVLYGSTREVRGVLAFLVDQLPRQEPLLDAEPASGGRAALLRATRTPLGQALQQAWTPHYCRPPGERAAPAAQRLDVSAGVFVCLQPVRTAAVAPSVLDWTARLLTAERAAASGTPLPTLSPHVARAIAEAEQQFPRPAQASAAAAVTASLAAVELLPPPGREPDQREQQERELTAATESLERWRAALADSSEQCRWLLRECTEEQAELAAETAALSERHTTLPLRRRARDALQAGGDAASGATAAERARQRAAHRHAEWTARRGELQRTLAELRRTARDAPLRELARRQTQLRDELAQRERALFALQRQASGLKKTVKRTAYTKRILEIVGSVKKQREAIGASVEETKMLRKSINSTAEKIGRTFQAAEEQMFAAAAGSEWSRAAYRGLVSLHERCAELVSLVEQTAAVLRRARRLQEMMELERSRRVRATLEQVRADLQKVRLENQLLRGHA